MPTGRAVGAISGGLAPHPPEHAGASLNGVRGTTISARPHCNRSIVDLALRVVLVEGGTLAA